MTDSLGSVRDEMVEPGSRRLAVRALERPLGVTRRAFEKAPNVCVLLGRIAAGAERRISSREPT